MIVVKYAGGLGNQMFQYAFSNILKDKNPNEHVYADLSRYDLLKEHEGFVLNKYFDTDIEIEPLPVLRRTSPINYILKRCGFSKLLTFFPTRKVEEINNKLETQDKKISIIEDHYILFHPDLFNLNYEYTDLWHYKGQWNNPLYWEEKENDISKLFRFRLELLQQKDKMLIEQMENEESVSIHIRKGDYQNNHCYNFLTEEYYTKALNLLEKEMGKKDLVIYVFCDDRNVNLDFLKKYRVEFVYHPADSGIDMFLMSNCKNNIIANSTFSFWGAMLNQKEDKVVIAPNYYIRLKGIFVGFKVPIKWKKIDIDMKKEGQIL